MHSLSSLLGILDFKPRTKNQDSPKTPEQILVNHNQEPRTKNQNQEPRFAQESWGNLGSWFLVLAENAF
jgi:hypothetical protein